MNHRLTLKPPRRLEQAANPEDSSSHMSGRRQAQELQNAFLTEMLDKMVTIYLVSGIKLTGKVRQFDQFTLQLEGADGLESLIFKHAISTLIPGVPAVARERRTPFGKRSEWIT
ncbi:MAG: RNA chaperone Hfq [Candidatus Competibacteraceae bacterium]